MNWLIAILAFIAFTIVALFIQKRIIEERSYHRPRFKITVHMLNGEPIVWDTCLRWEEARKHLPPCMSRIGDDRVTSYEILPP